MIMSASIALYLKIMFWLYVINAVMAVVIVSFYPTYPRIIKYERWHDMFRLICGVGLAIFLYYQGVV